MLTILTILTILTLLTFICFTYLPVSKRFFRPSRCPKETNSDRQVAVGDGRTAIVAGQAAAAADPAAARGRALVRIP